MRNRKGRWLISLFYSFWVSSCLGVVLFSIQEFTDPSSTEGVTLDPCRHNLRYTCSLFQIKTKCDSNNVKTLVSFAMIVCGIGKSRCT